MGTYRVGLDPSLLQIEMVALGEVGIPLLQVKGYRSNKQTILKENMNAHFAGLDAALNQIALVRLEDIRFHLARK